MRENERYNGLELDQRYVLDETIAQGALATVYRGRDTALRRPIAVKAVPAPYVDAYQRALATTTTLTYPSIVATYDTVKYDGWLFLVQEWVDAHPLSEYLISGMPGERAINLAAQIARTLAYAHEHRAVHGDLTAAAVLVDRRAVVRVNNFALPPDNRYFATACEMISRDMSLAALDELATPAGDIRAVGLLLWQLLTAVTDGQPRNYRVDIPETVRALVWQCVAADTSSRINDAETLAHALEKLGHELTVGRSIATEETPPTLRAVRINVMRSAAWSAEETQAPITWGDTTEPRSIDISMEPTAPRPVRVPLPRPTLPPSTDVVARVPLPRLPLPRPTLPPEPSGNPRLRLPSRPLTPEHVTGVPSIRMPRPSAPIEHYHGLEQEAITVANKRRSGLPALLLIGLALFMLFFLLGFMLPPLLGWK